MSRLQGKNAVILGAASKDNMAQVIARRFHQEGANVLVAGRKEEGLKAIAEELSGSYAICDITQKEQVAALADKAKSVLGGVDVAINATGLGLMKPFLENSEEDIDMMMDLQFKGPLLFFQSMIEAMENGGSLIQMSSATATIMVNDHAAYMGTKAGVDHVIRCIANEFGDRGIRANSISPGFTDTPMTAQAMAIPGMLEAFKQCYPLGRIGTSEDIAAAAVFLASDECYMSGENLQVNGGLRLRGNPTAKQVEESIAKAMQAAQ